MSVLIKQGVLISEVSFKRGIIVGAIATKHGLQLLRANGIKKFYYTTEAGMSFNRNLHCDSSY